MFYIMTTPNMLKAEFSKILQAQKAIENDAVFQSKKRRYQDISLETKYDQTAMSEIFQDPDLLSRISADTFLLMKLKARKSRVKSHLEYVTTKKPQAKDVPTNRVIPDYEKERLKALEENIDKQSKFINPIASKKRIYLAQNGGDPGHEIHELYEVQEPIRIESTTDSQATAESESSQTPLSVTNVINNQSSQDQTETESLSSQDQTPAVDIANTPADSVTSSLVLPALCIPENIPTPRSGSQVERDENPLEATFREIAFLFQQSSLKTVGPDNLYTLLPRQRNINALKLVQDDYTLQKKPSTTEGDQYDESSSLDDTLITITIFNQSNPNKKFQVVEILGSQPISDFRDAIYCLSDFSSNGDRKNKDPQGEVINSSGKKLSPAMIYMDHVFYIDTRLQDHLENYYTELIDAWLTKKGINKAVFRYDIKDMQHTLFQDALIHLQQPCVFLHQEKCEHMIIVQDVRLLSPAEYKSKDHFPRTTHNLRYDRFKCSLCTVYPATKITEEEINSGFSPCYWCDNCYESFHNANAEVNVTDYSGTIGGA